MDKSEIKKKKKWWFIASTILFAVAVGCFIGIIFVWDINRTAGDVLLTLCILSLIAGVITLSLGFAEGIPTTKRKHVQQTPEEEKVDEEEFEKICEYDLLDDD